MTLSKCADLWSTVYLVSVAMSFVGAGIIVYVSAKQLKELSGDMEENMTMGNGLDEVYRRLKKRENAEKKNAATAVMTVVGGDEEAGGGGAPPLSEMETELLKILKDICEHEKDVLQKKRKEDRTLSAIIQVGIEDIPVLLLNLSFIING